MSTTATIHVTIPRAPAAPVPQEPATTAFVVPAELEKAANETGLVADGVASLKSAFAPHFIKFHELAKEAATVGPNSPKVARAVRLELRAVRIAAEKTRETLKEDSLRRGKAIDGINAVLKYELVPIEEAMQKIEDAELIAEQNRIAALQLTRADELRAFMDPTHMDLGGMPDQQWSLLLTGAKAAHAAKVASDAKAEADRIEAARVAEEARKKKEADDLAERQRMQAENERLAKVAAEEKAKREAQEKEQAAANAERERLAKIERERVAAEQTKAEAAAKVEREKREAAEKELARIAQEKRDRDAAEAKAKAEKEAAELAAAKAAKAAPDKQKLQSFATTVRALQVPVLFAAEGAPALTLKIQEQVQKFAAWLEAEAGKL